MPRAIHPWERSYPPGVSWDVTIKPTTIPSLIDTSLARNAQKPAIDFRGQRISYASLAHDIDGVAATFLSNPAATRNGIALYLPNVPYHPIAFFGALKAGTHVVHLSPLDAERTLIHKLRDSGARTLVTTNLASLLPMALKLLDAGLIDTIYVGDDARWGDGSAKPLLLPERPNVCVLHGSPAPATWPDVSADDIALLQYTGGTTGLPKAAILCHGNLTAALQMYEPWYGGQGVSRPGHERIICVLPLFHIYALTTILLKHLVNGNEILLRQRFDVVQTIADIEIARATSFPGVPTMWIALANHPGIETCDFSSLVVCSSGGAPLPIDVQSRFERLTKLRLGGGWGMTETSPAGTLIPATARTKAGTIGLPIPGVLIEIVAVDEPTRVLPAGETGELRIKGPNVTRGYWNRSPEDNAKEFVDGYFLTGDIGRMDEDGFIFLVDRKKDLIISGGFNVYPQMIEQAIYEHQGVEEVVVIGIPDTYRGEAAKAFIKRRTDAPSFSIEDLRAFLADKLGRHELPSALEFRDSLPRTPVGKLSRLELRLEERSRAELKASGGTPP